jgi:hypothetical protein
MDRADDPLECQAQSFQQRVTSKPSRAWAMIRSVAEGPQLALCGLLGVVCHADLGGS